MKREMKRGKIAKLAQVRKTKADEVDDTTTEQMEKNILKNFHSKKIFKSLESKNNFLKCNWQRGTEQSNQNL